MYIMFTYGDSYVGKQASSNFEDAVHIYILFLQKVHCVKNDPWCASVCAFLSMLMRVKPNYDVFLQVHRACQRNLSTCQNDITHTRKRNSTIEGIYKLVNK